MKITRDSRLALVLVVVVFAFSGVALVSHQNTHELGEAGRAVAHSQGVLRELESLKSGVKDAQHGELAFLLSADPISLKPFLEAAPQVQHHLERLKELAATGQPQPRQMATLEQEIRSRFSEIRKIAQSRLQADSDPSERMLLVRQEAARMESACASIDRLAESESELQKRRSEELKSKAQLAAQSFLAMTLLTASLIGYVFCRLVQDMRARRLSMELLRHSEERYRLLAENSMDLISLVDSKGTLIYASPSHRQVLGLDPSQLIRQNLSGLIHPDDLARVHLAIAALAGTSQGRPVDARLRRAEGGWLEAEVLLSTFSMEGVAGHRILLSARDISERKQAQREREKLIEELQKAFARIKVLSGFIPICASCKKIRDDRGYWNQLEAYIQSHSEAQFSHGICPDCAAALYPDYFTKGA